MWLGRRRGKWTPRREETTLANTMDEPPANDGPNKSEWSPRKGLVRAAVWGTMTTLLVAALLAPLALYAPGLLIDLLLRTAVAFVVAWVLLGVVQRAAGMVGVHCSLLAVGLTLIVLLSHHLIFAVHGVPHVRGIVGRHAVYYAWVFRDVLTDQSGLLLGWGWLHPYVLANVNFVPLLAIAACALLCHRGGAGPDVLLGILRSRVFGRG